MFKSKMFKGAVAAVALAALAGVAQAAPMGIGSPISDAELAKWDISVFFDGENLPSAKGNLAEGEQLYQAQCAMCHGEFGEGARGYPKMLGAPMEEFHETAKHDGDNVAIRGINNLWGHAPTLADYIHRAMPFYAPQSLTWDQAFSITGYVLYLAEVIDDNGQEITADFLKSIKMPAADNYYTDPRPDVQNKRCMKDCFTGELVVKGKAVIGDVAVGAVEKREAVQH